MRRALRRSVVPLLAAALIAAALAATDLAPAFAQGGYGSGSGSMSASGSPSSGSSMGSASSAAASSQAPSSRSAQPMPRLGIATIYRVRHGDTLAGIARRFGVTIRALVSANPAITNINRIFMGQQLRIPSRTTVFRGDGDHDADDMVASGSAANPPRTVAPSGSQQAPASPAPASPQPMTPPSAPAAPAPQAVTVDLVAHNLMFNMSTITVPAGANVTVNFDNQDSGVPHNFAVYKDSSAQQAIFRGQIVTGPAKMAYTFTAPSQPGTYFFRCDVHFNMMTGQFVVR